MKVGSYRKIVSNWEDLIEEDAAIGLFDMHIHHHVLEKLKKGVTNNMIKSRKDE